MPKNKKRPKKQTAAQKASAGLKKGTARALGLLRSTPGFLREKGDALYRRADVFIRYKWSAALIALGMLALMLFTYSIQRYQYLFGNFPFYATRMAQFYLIDYSVGFVSRALVGHIISLFTDKVSFALIVRLTHIVLWISLALQAGLAALAFKKAWLQKSPLLCWLIVLFALSHHTVIPNVINFGVLDVYNLILAAVYVYLSDTKAGKWLAPLVCFTGIILHYQFVLAYLTMILSVELYYIVKNKKGRALRTALFCITVLGSGALAVYLVLFSKSHVKMDAAQLYDHMRAKYTDLKGFGLFEEYFTYYIYGDYQGANYSNPADFVKFLINYSLGKLNPMSHILYALSAFPVFGLLAFLWGGMAKRAPKKERLPYFVFLLQPLTLAAAMVVSTDTSRWAGACWFSCFMLLFTALRNEGPALAETAARATDKTWKKLAAAAVGLLSYACTVYIYASY